MCALVASLAVGVPGAALAEVRVHQAASVSLSIPEGWQAEGTQDRLLVARGNDAAMLLLVLPARPLEQTLTRLGPELRKFAGDSAWSDKLEPRSLHGMKALYARAPGKLDGTPVEVSVLAVTTPAPRSLLVVVVQRKVDAALRQEIDQILASPQPWR